MDFFLGTILYILIFLFFKKKSRYFYTVKNIVYWSILIRYFFALYHWYLGPFPIIGVFPDSGNDEKYFLEYATNFPLSMKTGWIEIFSPNLYPIVLGLFFKLFGVFNFVGSALNSFFGIIVLINVYRIYKIIWGDLNSRKAALLFLFLPMQAVYSVILIREGMLTFFLTTGVYFFMSWYFQSDKIKSLFLSLGFLLIAIFLHDAVVILLIPMIFYIIRKKSLRTTFPRLLFIIGLTSLVLYGGVLNYKLKEGLTIKKFENIRDNLVESERQFSYADKNENLVVLTFYFVLRPFIWEYQTGILRIFDTLIITMLIVLIISRFRHIRKNRRSKMLLIFSTTLIITFAMGSGDLYQSDRHRSKILPLLIATVPYSYRKIY